MFKWKVIFHQPFILLRLQFPTAKGLVFLSFSAFLHTTYSHSLRLCFWHWKDPFYTSINFRNFSFFSFSCRIDFTQHSCCKEWQLPNCVINLIKNIAGKKTNKQTNLRIFRHSALNKADVEKKSELNALKSVGDQVRNISQYRFLHHFQSGGNPTQKHSKDVLQWCYITERC